MPGNTIEINGNKNLTWYVGDSKMERLLEFLNTECERMEQFECCQCGNLDCNFGVVEAVETNEKERIYTIEDLLIWINDLVYPAKIDEIAQIKHDKNDDGNKTCAVNFYTEEYMYSIYAVERDDDKSYLSCGATCRKARAGEHWLRGNDLPDGRLSLNTWNRIMKGIVKYEVVKISPHSYNDAIIGDN